MYGNLYSMPMKNIEINDSLALAVLLAVVQFRQSVPTDSTDLGPWSDASKHI